MKLVFGDIDFAAGRIRVSKARTKGRTAGQRWLPVSDGLLDEIATLVPVEDRHRERLVFAGLTDVKVRRIWSELVATAGSPAYPPHSLRHRRCSLWYSSLRDAVAIKVWSGHSRASILTDTYSHVLLDHRDEWEQFWQAAYVEERSGGVRPVFAADSPDGREASPWFNPSLQES